MLDVSNVSKRFRKFQALDGVSFKIEKGSTVLLLGPNGAGKTTIIRCMMGLVNFKGVVRFEGLDVSRDGKKARMKMGYVPQYFTFYESAPVLDQANLVCKLKGADLSQVEQKLRMFNLWDVRRKSIKSLSSGMRQKLAIALALLNDPPFLIFDEPVTNVDVKGQLEFQSLIKHLSEEGKTILIATHLTGISEFATHAIVLDHGHVVATGTPEELLNRVDARDAIFVKVPIEKSEAVKNVLLSYAGSDGVQSEEDWLILQVPPHEKLQVLKSLFANGVPISDLLIEPSTLESQYMKLIGSKTST